VVPPAVLVEESRELQTDGEWQLPPSVEAVIE
jgi:hypothetical protein